ncbi:MAG: hypothetical protein ING02_13255 [Roseomonas sp.]|nr:hypothetical protein [Roseomonas sp.]
MPKLVIVTGSDSNMFYLAKGLILSLRRVLPLHDAELAFFDLGCTPQELAWLEARTHKLLRLKDDFSIANMQGFQPYRLGQACRALLPKYLPGYSSYMWMDADVWVQDPTVMKQFTDPAEKNLTAIVPECDVAYAFLREPASALQFHRYKFHQWTASYGEDDARKYALLPIFNNGVFAMGAQSPIWSLWERNMALSLQRGLTALFDQLSLQKSLLEAGGLHALPSRANWMSHYTLPYRRVEDSVWVEPRSSGQPIGIVHLIAAVRRETYLRRGMLYDDGDYLSPDEVPENLRAAFLAGRRRPVIGEGPGT